MATIESLLLLLDEDLEKLSTEQILHIWGPCFDLEKKLLADAGPPDKEDDEETPLAPRTPTAAKVKNLKKKEEMLAAMKMLLEQQKELEAMVPKGTITTI